MQYIVRARATNEIIAQGQGGQGVAVLEGNLYFDPKCVQTAALNQTERTYTCPYKGVCYWLDMENEHGLVQNAAWVYPDPKPGYEQIRNRIAFYSRETSGFIVEHNSDAA